MAEAYARQHYGKDYADAIHQSTQTTEQIAQGLDMIGLQNMQYQQLQAQNLNFWQDAAKKFNEAKNDAKNFKKDFQSTLKVAHQLEPLADTFIAKD